MLTFKGSYLYYFLANRFNYIFNPVRSFYC
jgi:hypothetical protein